VPCVAGSKGGKRNSETGEDRCTFLRRGGERTRRGLETQLKIRKDINWPCVKKKGGKGSKAAATLPNRGGKKERSTETFTLKTVRATKDRRKKTMDKSIDFETY